MSERKMSHFEFEKGDLEISFTYFYFLGFQLKIGKEESDLQDSPRLAHDSKEFLIQDKWRAKTGDLVHNLRNDFIEEILIDYFQLKIVNIRDVTDNISGGTVNISFDEIDGEYKISDNGRFKFKIDCRAPGVGDNSPGSIECFLLKNGHLVVTLRFVNSNTIPSYDAIELIRQPDLIKSEAEIHKTGILVKKSERIMDYIEPILEKILKDNEVTKLETNSKFHRVQVCLQIPKQSEGVGKKESPLRSIPYVGITFGFEKSTRNDIEALDESIKRFTISAARTTPKFLNSFTNPIGYLEVKNRNVYTPGDSIVYIAKRGWCVFDSGTRERNVFHNNVIESTFLTIIFIYSTSRTWYQYYRYIKDNGKSYFDNLNKSVIELVSNKDELSFCEYFMKDNRRLMKCHDYIADSTRFIAEARILAPTSGMSRLFEAHMMSHTARAAVKRCEELCHIVEIEDIASRTMANYSNSVKIAANHFQSETRTFSEKNLKIAIGSIIFFTIIPAIVNVIELVKKIL